MNINVENFCLIKKADLKLNSISVIGAENDTGKSTLGKILFSIFYARDIYLESFLELSLKEIKNIFDKISLEEDRIINMDNLILHEKIFDKLYLTNKNTKIHIKSKKKQLLNKLEEEILLNMKNYFEQKEELDIKKTKTFKGKYLNKGDNLFNATEKENLLERIKEIDMLVNAISNKEVLLYIKTNQIFYDEFSNRLSNFNSSNTKTSIILQEDTFKTDVIFEDGVQVEYNSTNFNKIKDVIYIETPLILDTNDLSENIFRKTLRKKLQNKQTQIETKETMILKEEVIKSINNIISGKLYYDQTEKVYKFKRSDEEIQIKSVASGIKSFGILSLLLENNHLTKDTILIIDEPEVHLHPKWQIKYAEILCVLSKKIGLKILANSHSPYFIEAISVYSSSNKYNLSDSVKFYSYDIYEDGNILMDKTNDLAFIYNKLAEPYDILNKEKFDQVL